MGILPILLGISSSIWRYIDGSDSRPKGSNLIGFALVILAAIYSSQLIWNPWHSIPLILCAIITGRQMTRGMPGWEEWIPMLQKFALPTFIGGVIFSFCAGFQLNHLVFMFSGLIVASTYVMFSKWEAEKKLPDFFKKHNMTAEKLGRISYGFMTLGLALL